MRTHGVMKVTNEIHHTIMSNVFLNEFRALENYFTWEMKVTIE